MESLSTIPLGKQRNYGERFAKSRLTQAVRIAVSKMKS